MSIYLCMFLLLLGISSPTTSYTYLPPQELITYEYLSYKANPVTDIKNVPHHVLIVYSTKYCSGSLTGSRLVITAASCFGKHNGESVVVKVGSNSMVGSGQIIQVLEYKIHEYFRYLHFIDNDIALVMLKDHVFFGENVIKTQIVEPEVALRTGTPVKVAGWGGTDLPVKYLNLILQSVMTVVNETECRGVHGNLKSPSNFCARYHIDRRLSDNGGGATFGGILVGILSWGASGTDTYNLAILTNVSYFERWITLNTIKFLTKYCSLKETQKHVIPQSEEYMDS